MTDRQSDIGPIIPGPYLSPQQNESSPLRQSIFGSTKKSIESWLWGWDFSLDGTGSLKSVVVFLFGTAGAVTLALLTQIYYGDSQLMRHGAVATDHSDCTDIGILMLEKGGHAVDAAVAAAVCLGVVHFHVTGLGGGGFLLGYNQRNKEVFDVLNFTPSKPERVTNLDVPGQKVGVPGFLAGLWSAHQRHGRLPWSDLIMPSVNLARHGFRISSSLASAASCLQPTEHVGDLSTLLSSLVAEQNTSLPRLGATLELVAAKGIDDRKNLLQDLRVTGLQKLPTDVLFSLVLVFYNGSLANEVVFAVKTANGAMEQSDLAAYLPIQGFSEKTLFQDFQIIVPSSFGGNFLLNALEAIQDLDLRPPEDFTAEMVRDVLDRLYDTQQTLSKKSNITVRANPAASAVTVMDSEDNYVSIVSGLNTILGSQLLTESGFLLNNALANGIDPSGSPVSLSTPVVAVEAGKTCGQRIVLGSADARSLAQVLTQFITFREPVNDSIEAPRFHIGQGSRSILLEDHHEPTLSDITVKALDDMAVAVGVQQLCPAGFAPYGSINGISKIDDSMWPYADSRGGGEAILF